MTGQVSGRLVDGVRGAGGDVRRRASRGISRPLLCTRAYMHDSNDNDDTVMVYREARHGKKRLRCRTTDLRGCGLVPSTTAKDALAAPS